MKLFIKKIENNIFILRFFIIYFLLFYSINSLESFANVIFLPRSRADLDLLADKARSVEDSMVAVQGAKVAYFNRDALTRDFPFLKGKSDREIEEWILRECAFISQSQLGLNGIRQSNIPIARATKKAFRPSGWNRAAVIPVSKLGDGSAFGLIDVKGAGNYDPARVAGQISQYLENKSDPQFIDELRVRGHSDGLATLGEAISEVVRAEALQASFDEYNRQIGTQYETVEHYFIISLPFQILKEKGRGETAALIGRQSHLGRVYRNFDTIVPRFLYIDPHGGKQTDLLGAVVDMGGVFPTSVARGFRDKFLTPKQRGDFEKGSLDPQLERGIYDPQTSQEWTYAHEVAKAFERGDEKVIYRHLGEMVGSREIDAERKIESFSDAVIQLMTDSNRKLSELAQDALRKQPLRDVKLALRLLKHEDPMIRKKSMNSSFYDGSLFGLVVITGLADVDPEVRRSAVDLLKRAEPHFYLKILKNEFRGLDLNTTQLGLELFSEFEHQLADWQVVDFCRWIFSRSNSKLNSDFLSVVQNDECLILAAQSADRQIKSDVVERISSGWDVSPRFIDLALNGKDTELFDAAVIRMRRVVEGLREDADPFLQYENQVAAAALNPRVPAELRRRFSESIIWCSETNVLRLFHEGINGKDRILQEIVFDFLSKPILIRSERIYLKLFQEVISSSNEEVQALLVKSLQNVPEVLRQDVFEKVFAFLKNTNSTIRKNAARIIRELFSDKIQNPRVSKYSFAVDYVLKGCPDDPNPRQLDEINELLRVLVEGKHAK